MGLLRYGEAEQAGAATLRLDQMANASSWNATTTRRFVGSSAASSRHGIEADMALDRPRGRYQPQAAHNHEDHDLRLEY